MNSELRTKNYPRRVFFKPPLRMADQSDMEPDIYSLWTSATRVCVIGAGTMGSGIAAHLANLGFEVTLLDLTGESVRRAFDKAKSAKPPHFFLPERANSVRLGSIEENLEWVVEADWVCEAIIEKLDAKKTLFEKLETVIRPDAMISTNTSGLQIGLLAEGRSESFQKRFLGTHFFNPPRYLKLLELIPTETTDPMAVAAMTKFLEERCARRVVLAKDTPGFIANRYGMWSMFQATHTAEKLGFSIEESDAISGPFMGRPRSASFRLNDLVGIDIMLDISQNLLQRCPEDPYIQTLKTPASLRHLMEKGWLGEKFGHGYYRREGKELLALDLKTFAYRNKQDVHFSSLETLGKLPLGERLREGLKLKDEVGEFLRGHLLPILEYANYLKAGISYNVRDFDRVMKWGFGWEMGPFELIDAIEQPAKQFYSGAQMLGFDGEYQTPEPEPLFATLSDFPITGGTETFSLRDMGDGVTAICIKTKLGCITTQLVDDLNKFLEESSKGPYVLTSEARSFSVGFDLKFLMASIDSGNFAIIDEKLIELQRLGENLERTRTVAAIFGYTLGAGLETALSCSQIVAAADSQIGLPESKVGLIPAGRGATLLRLYNQSEAHRLTHTAMTLTDGTTSANADQAKLLGYLRPTDFIEYHPDRLLARAKELALLAQPTARPVWQPVNGPLIGMIDRAQEEKKAKGEMTDYDETIGDKIKAVFAKSTSYEEAIAKERSEFLDLCSRQPTQVRLRHMVETNKPMKN